MKGNKCVMKTVTLDSEMITLINIDFDSEVQSMEAMIAMINKERALYKACPTDECNKKVNNLGEN